MGAWPARRFTTGGGGSYFLKGSRPPVRLDTTGFCGGVSWATTPSAKPLAITIAALSRRVVNRSLDVSLTCIIIFASSSEFISGVAGQERQEQVRLHPRRPWRLAPEPGSANALKKRNRLSNQNERQPFWSATVCPTASIRNL